MRTSRISVCTSLVIGLSIPGRLDLSDRRPQRLTHELAEEADVVVTMGCGDACPYIPGKRYIDWDLTDPKARPVSQVRAIRDDIAGRVRQLLAELDRSASLGAAR